ncbi:Uncharacterized protein MCHI_003891 [Candidatus Magnetoovum chiemensis]|nr:Uncharacterized protein MCHI_003891 [Candidatus Magnetoovum chiemensis]
MKRDMKIADVVLFYHSNCKEPGIVGLARVSKEAYPDHTAFDNASKYYDRKSSPDNPRWFMVDVTWMLDFKRIVTLKTIKSIPALQRMKLVQKGQRLSIQPVTKEEFDIIYELGTV